MTTTTTTTGQVTYIIPCSGDKLDHPAPARNLYTGPMFRHTLAAAQTEAAATGARVLVLSARYGLVSLDDVIGPYQTKMGDPDSITADDLATQAYLLGIDWGTEVYAMLPGAYFARLNEALQTIDVYPQDVYEATAGIGDQRHVNAIVNR